MTDTIFSVTPQNLSHLTADGAVDVFRSLLWAEAVSIGVNATLINVPTAITVADGGIDAEIQNSIIPVGLGRGIIKNGLTRYQIKTGEFGVTDANIKSVLFDDRGNIKPRIKSCFDRNGVFVLVLFGWDNPQPTDEAVILRAKEALARIDARYESAQIEVWQQNQLMSFLQLHPSLSLVVNGHSGRFQSHKSWKRDANMTPFLKLGPEQEEFIRNLQTELRKVSSEAIHIRVRGEAGVGKTRLVLEATSTDDFSPTVIYYQNAESFIDSDLMNLLLRDDNHFFVLLVIDECSIHQMSQILTRLKFNNKIKIITIYNEFDIASGISVLDVSLLPKEKIKEIISSYGVLGDGIDRFADLCDGYPRVAHCIGANLVANPSDPLRPTSTRTDIWQRFIADSDRDSDPEVEIRFLVLRFISLFKRFGYGPPVTEESRFIAQKIQNADPRITWDKFKQVVQDLRQRKVLQGETTLYITPTALHIWLWSQWWSLNGTDFNQDEFLRGVPSGSALPTWFHEMFRYAQQSEAAATVVKDLLGPNGVFRDE